MNSFRSGDSLRFTASVVDADGDLAGGRLIDPDNTTRVFATFSATSTNGIYEATINSSDLIFGAGSLPTFRFAAEFTDQAGNESTSQPVSVMLLCNLDQATCSGMCRTEQTTACGSGCVNCNQTFPGQVLGCEMSQCVGNIPRNNVTGPCQDICVGRGMTCRVNCFSVSDQNCICGQQS